MAKKKRNYKKEYAEYHGTAEQKKNRAARGRARYDAEKAGKVSKGDGKEVDHIKPLSKGGSNSPSNTRVVTKEENRSRKRGATKKTAKKKTARRKVLSRQKGRA